MNDPRSVEPRRALSNAADGEQAFRQRVLLDPACKKRGRSEDRPLYSGVSPPERRDPSYQPEPGPKVTSTRRFCGSRTPSAVSTSGRLSPNASVVMTPSGMPRPARYERTFAARRCDRPTLYWSEPERSAWPAIITWAWPQV